MRKTIIVLVAAIVLVVAGVVLWRVFNPGPLAFAGGTSIPLVDYHAANPTSAPAGLNGADVVKRGEYLARAADCVVCHTSPGGQQYAGGLAIPLPFGTLYSTNITPDKATGIGDYSDENFLNAVQRGFRRDGAHLYPAMPYPSYTYMTDADALAIKAYLFSLAPVRLRPIERTRWDSHSISVKPLKWPMVILLRRNANTALGGDRLDLHNVPKFSEAFNQALFLLVG